MDYVTAVVYARRIRHQIAYIVTGIEPLPTAGYDVLPKAMEDLEPNPSAVTHLICAIHMSPGLSARARTLEGADAVAFMDELQLVSLLQRRWMRWINLTRNISS